MTMAILCRASIALACLAASVFLCMRGHEAFAIVWLIFFALCCPDEKASR